MKKNIELDAQLVLAVRANMLEYFGIFSGLKPGEVFTRRDWLPKQSRQYLHSVEMRIKQIELERLKNKLK